MIRDGNPNPDLLLRFDAGVLTTVGSIGFDDVRGIAFDPTSGTTFGVSRTSSRLIKIDLGSAAGTTVGASSYLPVNSNSNEISVNAAGDMFGIGHLNDQTASDTLLSVNKATGVATAVGSFGGPLDMTGLAFNR